MKSISFGNLLGQNKHIFKKQLYLSHLPPYIHVIELAVYINMDRLCCMTWQKISSCSELASHW